MNLAEEVVNNFYVEAIAENTAAIDDRNEARSVACNAMKKRKLN